MPQSLGDHSVIPSAGKIIQNERGFVLIASILISTLVILIGAFSIWTSNTEVMVVRNEGQSLREFYNAEGGAIDALVNYTTGTTNWLTDDFLLAGPSAASNVVTSYNQQGIAVARVEARCIEETGTSIPSLTDAANNMPHLPHIGPPPTGGGYSMKFFEARRYGVTATSTTGNTQIQIGAWKVFNKY
jgi:hypothetical protein